MNSYARAILIGIVLLTSASVASAATDKTFLDPQHSDLPDTSGLAAELTAFAQLAPDEQQARTARTEFLLKTWLSNFKIKDGRVKVGLYGALGKACYYQMRTRTYDTSMGEAPDILSAAIVDFRAAVEQDPTHTMARVILGMVLIQTGSQREGINHLEKSLLG